ncbi:MAG: hypothetical protein IJP17_02330 [Clostridia bacterium]|nr:hypothetical protein [Clostridia bacterium]
MKDNNIENIKEKKDPAERVERMNGIFDRLVLPMLLFTLAIFLIFGVAPKVISCDKQDSSTVTENASQGDFYASRAALLTDMENNLTRFETAGYILVDDDSTGTVAYKKLDSGTEIMENLCDVNGNIFSAVSSARTIGEKDADVTIMVYSGSLFLVSVTVGEETTSAIFGSDMFLPPISGSDEDISAVLALVPSDDLAEMMEEYRQALRVVMGEK